MKNPNCSKCKHFFITLDERKPRACKVFNIKGRNMPSIDVKRFTGFICPVFEEKITAKNKTFITDRALDFFA